ncbi:MAG: flagellar hook-associated protein 1 FlgK [Bermanella sp.]|jgi:flagellar hook-associated protein 1 FlgK
MGDILAIGISGLRAHQTALSVTGNNIANVDTEGYSRQDATITNNTPQFQDGVWIGAGASVEKVRRIYDEFLVGQMQKDTSTFNFFDTLSSNAGQVDKLLADPSTGIQPGIESMFGSFQAAIDDPSSLPARQVVISESQGLVDRFSAINDQLNDSNNIVNGQLGVFTTQISTLAESISELNEQITFAQSSANGNFPNDLLDKRDLAITQLSELVTINVVEQDGDTLNIFIGSGQALVVGNDFNTITTKPSENDPSRDAVVYERNGVVQEITKELSGGQIGGLLEYRNTVLDPAINQLGRLALALQTEINSQHQLGIDLNGTQGGLFFSDVNDPVIAQQRVIGNAGNELPNDRTVGVYITDSNKLSDSDYKVEFIGPNNYTFTVTREKDGETLFTNSLSTEFPESFDIEGFDLTFEGGTFKKGDEFYLQPTRGAASKIELDLQIPQGLALATAVITEFDVGNQGQANISLGTVYDMGTAAFEAPGELAPPLIIKFTSDRTYDVLDNSDPANPVALFPPIMNQNFVPGVVNDLLPKDEGKTAITTVGGYLPGSAFYQDFNEVFVTPGNGFFPARLNIEDPDFINGGTKSRGVLTIPGETPANEIATILSNQKGITASARTTIQLTKFTDDPSGFLDQKMYLNGVELTDTLPDGQIKYEADYPFDVPNQINSDFLADRINANFDFQKMGIMAKSDGSTLTITAINGEDLSIELQGDNGDSATVSNGQNIYLKPIGEGLSQPLNKFDGYDFTEGGPFTYEFEVPGQGTYSIELTDSYATGADVIADIEAKINSSNFSNNGTVAVDIDERGNISFQNQLNISPSGTNGSAKLTMGGQVKVVLDEGLVITSQPPLSNLFEEFPEQKSVYLGYEVTMDGVPKEGDLFYVDFNDDAVTDNRNGGLLGAVQSKELIEGEMTISEAYGKSVEEVGSITARAQINSESSEVLLANSKNSVSSVSGVNLDEEAANLIRFEQGYNASAQVISVARDIFSTLIGIFR